MKGNLSQILKQAQEMQANMQKAQEELGKLEVRGEAGGGMVAVVMTCRYEVARVEIDDSLIGDDKDMLEDLVAAAFNDGARKVERTIQEKFAGMAGGLKMPGLL